MSHLLPSAIFSPSLARQHLATTKDWNYIDAWLTQKLGNKPPPPFERNAETLKTLLALAAQNESADEERELLARVEAKALQESKTKEEHDPDKELLERIEQSMSREGQASLQAIAQLGVNMNMPIPEVERIGRGLVNLQVAVFDLEQASERISVLESHLSEELVKIKKIVEQLQSDAYQTPTDLQKQTTDYQRRTKALASKLPELKDRVTAMQAGLAGSLVTIEDVRGQEHMFRELTAAVKNLETQVKGFYGLPQDTDLARLELESLRVELRDLTQERDRMFEGLVERESPKKTRS